MEDLAQAPVVRLEGGADLLDLAELDRVGHDHKDRVLRVVDGVLKDGEDRDAPLLEDLSQVGDDADGVAEADADVEGGDVPAQG